MDSYNTANTKISPKAITKQNVDSHHIRRAEPHNLPGHPIAGLTNPESAGTAAASLAYSVPKPVLAWKPNTTSAASAAASLAHTSREVGGLRNSPSTTRIGPDLPSQGSKGNLSLRGARGAMNPEGNRRRADSSPGGLGYERDSTVTSSTKRDSGFVISPEEDVLAQTRQKSDILTAATVSMTNDKLKRKEVFQSPPRRPHDDSGPPSVNTPVPRRPKYPNLEEAARRQAEERLARIGYLPASRSIASGRTRSVSLSSNHLRPQSYDTLDLDEDIDRTDRRKRGQDALLLMSTARKNVQTRLSEQDRQIAKSRASRKDWLPKATEIAQRQSDQRMQRTQNHGKVDIGGGKYMTQEEIDRIAERNVRPVIDDINERAEEHHQLKRERRKEKTREMARRLDEADKKIFSFRRRHEVQVESGSRVSPRPNSDEQGQNGEDGNSGQDPASVAGENRVRNREESDRAEGRTTLLDKITGKSHTHSSPESRGALNSIGMVRGHVVQKTRMDRAVDSDGDDARSPTALGEGITVTNDNQASPVGTDTVEAHPTSSGGGKKEASRDSLFGYLKRPFVRRTPSNSRQATAPSTTGSCGGIGSDFFVRIRGSKTEPSERQKLARDTADRTTEIQTELTTSRPHNETVTVQTEERTVVTCRGTEPEIGITEEDSLYEISHEGISPIVINIPDEGEVVVQTTVTEIVTTTTPIKDVPGGENEAMAAGKSVEEASEANILGPATPSRTPTNDPSPKETVGSSTKGKEIVDPQSTSADTTVRKPTEIIEKAEEGSKHRGTEFSDVPQYFRGGRGPGIEENVG
ncbi:hypothetical protein BDD12DRAFT_805134 [Trichophaea hybrida]|nr:hypothetical protein BDD12DRAFT_805134 [Trichophaea hybrida]